MNFTKMLTYEPIATASSITEKEADNVLYIGSIYIRIFNVITINRLLWASKKYLI